MSIQSILTIIGIMLGCTGFWTFLQSRVQRRDKKQDDREATNRNQTKLLLGIAHDRIMRLGTSYIRRGYITPDEYENLHDYLWKPYVAEDGDGACARIMKEVEGLPIKEEG